MKAIKCGYILLCISVFLYQTLSLLIKYFQNPTARGTAPKVRDKSKSQKKNKNKQYWQEQLDNHNK